MKTKEKKEKKKKVGYPRAHRVDTPFSHLFIFIVVIIIIIIIIIYYYYCLKY